MHRPLTRRQFAAGVTSACLAGRAVAAGARFEIETSAYTTELYHGDVWDGDFDVENEGTDRGTTDVRLYFEGADSVPSEKVTLDPEETDNVVFTLDTEPLELGVHDCRVETEDDTKSFKVTLTRPATYHLSDVALDDGTVRQGESVTVEGFVENVGDDDGDYPVECFLDGEHRDGYEPALDPGESDDFSFTVETDDLVAGEYEVAVQTPDDAETRTLAVTRPAQFEFEDWQPPSEPIPQGVRLMVRATVANTGGVDGNADVRLLVDDKRRDEQTVPLAPSESKTVELTFDTNPLSPGTHTVSVHTDDGGMGRSFTVAEPAAFEVTDWTPPATVEPGEPVSVDATITNVGGVGGEADVVLRIDGTVRDEQSVSLAAGGSKTVTLGFTPDGDSSGEHDVVVATADHGRGDGFVVREPADFRVTNAHVSSDAVPTDGRFEVSADVRNDGGTDGEQTVWLAIDGDRVDDERVFLPADSEDPVAFPVDVDVLDLDAGTHEIRVSVGDSSARTEVRIYRPTTTTVVEANAAEQSTPTERPTTVEADVADATAADAASRTTEKQAFPDDEWATTAVETPDGDEPVLPKVPRSVQWAAAISSITGVTFLGLHQMTKD